MDHLLTLPDERRQVLFDEAGARLGLSAGSVEKDLWACWILRTLFALPASGRHLTFKGGTSLSKGWRLIQRFSDDLDIVLDRDVLGFRGEQAPEAAPSQKQRAKRLDALRVACQQYVRETLLPELDQRLHGTPVDPDRWQLIMDPDDVDAQTILYGASLAQARFPTSLGCEPGDTTGQETRPVTQKSTSTAQPGGDAPDTKDLVAMLRSEAAEVKDCFTRYSFAAMTFASASLAATIAAHGKFDWAEYVPLATLPLLMAVCRIGIHKYTTANRHYGYELHLSRIRGSKHRVGCRS